MDVSLCAWQNRKTGRNFILFKRFKHTTLNDSPIPAKKRIFLFRKNPNDAKNRGFWSEVKLIYYGLYREKAKYDTNRKN
jgi:hypothetical protein